MEQAVKEFFEAEPDDVITVLDADGHEIDVEIVYGDLDYREVFSGIIRAHYLG